MVLGTATGPHAQPCRRQELPRARGHVRVLYQAALQLLTLRVLKRHLACVPLPRHAQDAPKSEREPPPGANSGRARPPSPRGAPECVLPPFCQDLGWRRRARRPPSSFRCRARWGAATVPGACSTPSPPTWLSLWSMPSLIPGVFGRPCISGTGS